MPDSLVYGGLELLSGPGGTYHITTNQRGLGDPQTVTTTVRSQLTDGSFVTGNFTDNRPVSLQVLILASSRLALTLAYEALLAQAKQPFNTLLWTPSGGYQMAFDTYRAQPTTQWSGIVEQQSARIVTLTMAASPYGRSTLRSMIAGQAASIQLGYFDQTTEYTYKTVTAGGSYPGKDPRGVFSGVPVPTVTGTVYGPQTTPTPIDGKASCMRVDSNFYTYGGSGPYTYYNSEARIGPIALAPSGPVSVAAVGAAGTVAGTGTPLHLFVPYPTGLTSSQIMILAVTTGDAGTLTVTTPTGWALIDQTPGPGGTAEAVSLYWKRALGSESGNLDVSVAGGPATWLGWIIALNSARLTGNPFAHSIHGSSPSTVTSVTTSSLTVDTTAPSGRRFAMCVMANSLSSNNTWSAESWSGLTGATNTETRDIGGTLIDTVTATGGTASTFTATTASTVGYAYVALDIVEASALALDLSTNTSIVAAIYVGSPGNTPNPYYDAVQMWLTLVDNTSATQSFLMSGTPPGFSGGYYASPGWMYLTCTLTNATIDFAHITSWQIDINNPQTSYNLPTPTTNAYYLGMLRAYPLSSALTTTALSTVVKIPAVPGSAQAPASIEIDRGGGGATETGMLVYRAPAGTATTTPLILPLSAGAGVTTAPSTFSGTYRMIHVASASIVAGAGSAWTLTQQVNGVTVASISGVSAVVGAATKFLDFGDVTLPLVDVPGAVSTVTYTMAYGGSTTGDLLFCDTRGFLVWAPAFAAIQYFWIDEASVSAAGGVYGGVSANRTDAVSLLGGSAVQTNGAMSLDPGDNYLLVADPDGVPSNIVVSFFPRYVGERTAL